MKYLVCILILLFTIFSFGCSTDNYIELPYSIQHAYSKNEVIEIENGNKSYNIERIEEFISNIKKGKRSNIRIVSYHTDEYKFDWDNPRIIQDLSYNGRHISLTIYCTYSVSSIKKIKRTNSYKYSTIDKFTTKEEVQYVLIGSKNRKRMILSLLKNGFIDKESQKYLYNELNKK